MPAYKLLIVAGDQGTLRSLEAHFAKLGHEVFEAETGEQGLSLHERVEPHVTVLDLVLPGMSGMEVLEILRTRQASVIMLTGQGHVETAVEAMRLGAENFLVKPVDVGHLSVAVERAAEKTILRRENIELKSRLYPSFKRRLVRYALLAVLVVVSTGLGMLIGGIGGDDRPRNPAPTSIDSAG